MSYYIKGDVFVRVEGVLIEKFINKALSLGVTMHATKRDRASLSARVSLSDFYKLRVVARESGCQIFIKRRRGLSFIAGTLKHRFMLVVGMILCVAALALMQTRVLLVGVDGDSTCAALVSEELREMGIVPGIAKSEIDMPMLENLLISRLPELGWVSMEIRGMKLQVNVASAVLPPEIIDMDSPSYLIADRDAVVSSIQTQSGTPLVKPGDTISAGQVLISGQERAFNGETRAVRAIGIVKGRISFEGIGEAIIYEEANKPTGQRAVVRSIRVFDRTFRLDNPPDYAHYDKSLKFVDILGLFLPVWEVVEEYFEAVPGKIPRDITLAKQEALMLAEINAYKQLPDGAEVVDKRVNFSMIDDEWLCASVYVEVELSIAKEMKE